ncbi:hypothetical protein LTS08_002612 [Lithohypha guttulata]|uniref:uncharacterized protein n=1 Tax=Lithohypha guttulata TaxID=1690604 RepID=UPI002DE1CFE3|nr:hypothetical protein LTR51_001781 [Lithohypha guttulata]KAK5104720.1 hypothetical protein LTS08_002612 [Lithohypha guttulata]
MTVHTEPHASRDATHRVGQHQDFSTTAINERLQSQRARTADNSVDEQEYVLTLLTDPAHHEYMTSFRKKYFPAKLNKLEAHITMFHALPESKLESDVLPAIQDITSKTSEYRIRATNAFRLSKGVAIAVADDIEHPKMGSHKRNMTRIIHAELRKKWSGWLSEQDSAPPKLHYTVMNKVTDDKVINNALHELHEELSRAEKERPELESAVKGLTLWKYERGFWNDPQHFIFGKGTS